MPWLLLLFSLLFVNAHADTPKVSSSGHLQISGVSAGGTNYKVSLQLLSNHSSLIFELRPKITESRSESNASYSNGILTLPEVIYENSKYSATMALIENTSPMQFQVTGATFLCSDC